MKGLWIETLAWPEVGEKIAAGWPVVVPIGARAKEHGHHLPMQTDFLLARALADGVAAQVPVLVAPVIDFGYYPAFIAYPGSQHLAAETFIRVVEDIITRLIAQGAKDIYVINTGVSTEAPLQIAARNIYTSLRREIALAHIRDLGHKSRDILQQKFGGHGDEHETSLILAIAPDMVDMSKARTDYGNLLGAPKNVFGLVSEFSPDPNSRQHYSATGVRGDPTLASAEKGRIILAAMIEDLVNGIRILRPDLP